MRQLTILILMICCAQLGAQDTFFSISDALQEAETEDKPIMLVFSGSDWCKPCIELKKSVLDSPEFQSFSEEVILLHLDFPYKKSNRLSKNQTKHNEQLADEFNPQGQFPKIILINSDRKYMGEVVYEKGLKPTQFIDHLKPLLL